ncbi:MAG: AAA domain-containing protein [Acidimicrobiia bacterium]|nr:AAA domain-containing protein [Acidimicrobiia bacterium]
MRRHKVGSRIEGADSVYAVAELWVERALRRDDSLFTPGESIWSSRLLDELYNRFLNQPDGSDKGFFAKLNQQLLGSPPEVHQLMAEVLYVHYLIVWEGAMRPSKKEEQIRQVLRWANAPIPMPKHLVAGLSPGLAHPGQAFFNYRPFQVGFFIEFARLWKAQAPREQRRLLDNPGAFKQFLDFKPTSRLFEEHGDGTYRAQRAALPHLVFPDAFEPIVSTNHKTLMCEAFSSLVAEPTGDVDQDIQQIRRGLESKQGRNFNFYDDDIRAKWDPKVKGLWDEYISQAQACVDTGLLDSWENNYKVDIGRKLAEARSAVLAEEDNWVEVLTKSLPDNPLGWRSRLNLLNWIEESPVEALKALQAIWTKIPSSLEGRIRHFSDLFPSSHVSGTGVRMRYISVLLMGLDVDQYPPFQTTTFQKAYVRTGHEKPAKDADEAALYLHALNFLDLFMEEASERGLKLRHRLDAQSLVWMIEDPPEQPPPSGGTKNPPPLESLATRLHLPVDFLEEIETLLKEKRQVVFQGPPGTGKTYVAQKLAEQLAGSKDRVTLVQFHPSYAYEDFVQGYRPSLLDGQPGFELKDGPLLQAARRAEEDSEGDHYLVIDEINRGNLAKVFGELYFLLEYRNEKMRLQYQADTELSLPENLYIIGTMNTADRSIALVDLALRRRFYFVEFHPDDDPIKSLLRNWLREKASKMEWVADVIDLVNKKLQSDRHVAIGPSYFMGTDEEGNAVVTDETSVRRVWEHSVRPYIEEHLFGNLDGMDEWDLDKLRKQAKGAGKENEGDEEESTRADASN